MSILLEDKTVQDAIAKLETHFDRVGDKKREYHPRVQYWEEQGHELSPIPDFQQTTPSQDQLQQDFLAAKKAILDCMRENIGEGKEFKTDTYYNRFERINDPVELLETYHTFYQRFSPEAQAEHKQNLQRSKDREYLTELRDRIQEGIQPGSEQKNPVERWIEVFDTLDTDLAHKMVMKIQRLRKKKGKGLEIIKTVNDFMMIQKERSLEATAESVLKKVKKARKSVQKLNNFS